MNFWAIDQYHTGDPEEWRTKRYVHYHQQCSHQYRGIPSVGYALEQVEKDREAASIRGLERGQGKSDAGARSGGKWGLSFYVDAVRAPIQDNCTETIQRHYRNKACSFFHHANFFV